MFLQFCWASHSFYILSSPLIWTGILKAGFHIVVSGCPDRTQLYLRQPRDNPGRQLFAVVCWHLGLISIYFSRSPRVVSLSFWSDLRQLYGDQPLVNKPHLYVLDGQLYRPKTEKLSEKWTFAQVTCTWGDLIWQNCRMMEWNNEKEYDPKH